MKSPTTSEVLKARKDAGLTQTQAAELVGYTLRAWQGWEAKEGTKAHRKMPSAVFELFLIKTKNLVKDRLQKMLDEMDESDVRVRLVGTPPKNNKKMEKIIKAFRNS